MHKRCFTVLSLAVAFSLLCHSSWAAEQTASLPITVEVSEGPITINTQGETIEKIVRTIGRIAGVDVGRPGNLGRPVHLSTGNMPLARLLDKLANKYSFIVIDNPAEKDSRKHPNRSIATVYIVASRGPSVVSPQPANEASEEIARVDSESLKARRLLADILDNKKWVTPEERKAVIERLTSSADAGSVDILERVVTRTTDSGVREDVMDALAHISGRAATLALGRISLGNFSSQARRLAIRALAARDSDISRFYLTSALDDHDAQVRIEAASALDR